MANVAFLWILSRGMELGVIVLCLLPLRIVLRKIAPRLFSYLLWCALPVNIVYNFLIRLATEMPRQIGKIAFDETPFIIGERLLDILKWSWIIGITMMLLVMLASYIRFQRCLVGSIRLKNNVYLAGRISAPFSMGLFCPKVYLPTSIGEEYYEPVILHEQVHIRRKDIWMKHVAVAFMAIFWFQPLLWFAYHLFINDMEEACDEAVLREKGNGFSKEYAKALVEVSYQSGKVQGVAIGYGSGEVKARVKHVMSYKRSRFLTCLIAVLLCIFFMAVSIPISWQIPRIAQMEPKAEMVRPELSVNEIKMEKQEVIEEFSE